MPGEYHAYLIDPFERQVTVVTLDDDSRISERLHCDLITGARIDGQNILYVDDEGLVGSKPDNQPDQQFFRLGSADYVFAGYGLIVGVTESGESKTTTLPFLHVRANVNWVDDEVIEVPPIVFKTWDKDGAETREEFPNRPIVRVKREESKDGS